MNTLELLRKTEVSISVLITKPLCISFNSSFCIMLCDAGAVTL